MREVGPDTVVWVNPLNHFKTCPLDEDETRLRKISLLEFGIVSHGEISITTFGSGLVRRPDFQESKLAGDGGDRYSEQGGRLGFL